MTADWWNTPPTPPEEDTSAPDSLRVPDAPVGLPTIAQEPDRGEQISTSSPRVKASKIVGGVTGGIIAGVLIVQGISGGDGGNEVVPAPGSAESREGLPTAGDRPKDRLPATDGATTDNQKDQPSTTSRNVVTLTAAPSGKGRVGAVMKVSIRNNTDEPVTVLATMIKGDGRPAIAGEGTLAPNSRTVQPNEEAEGTVEFSASTAPQQVALLDLSGNVMAVSGDG